MPLATASLLPPPCRDEAERVRASLDRLRAGGGFDWANVIATARPWVDAVRRAPAPFWAMESLLREYPISSAEGLALMRLAEALLRVPDAETAIALTADQLGRADFGGAADGSPHKLLAGLSASAIGLAKRFLPDEQGSRPGLMERLGAQTVVAATVRAIQLLGRQFVLGRSIAEALGEARSQRRDQPALRFSFDMLGEGARTDADALRYLASYTDAIQAIAAATAGQVPAVAGHGPAIRDGISIKLSALHPRYEALQRDRVMAELLPRVQGLIDIAARADINFTIDAEECDRLELSLEVFDRLAAHVQTTAPQWQGFGLAIQSYQTRALETIDAVADIARRRGLRFMVRLVKGAYWDGEVKRAQELGLDGYPVFTHKHHTDLSYLACAKALIDHHALILTQFATHNAGTVAAIVGMAKAAEARFEMQRLHGMGEGLYREVLASLPTMALRVYAPVGEHRDLLAYLVRRLLENGANSSFVHQMADAEVPIEALLQSPLHAADGPGQPAPVAMFGRERDNSTGADLTVPEQHSPLLAAVAAAQVPTVPLAAGTDVAEAMARLDAAFDAWAVRPVAERAAIVRRAGDLLDARLAAFSGLLVREAGKTLGDCVAEVREAVDFCRFYAAQAEARLAPIALPGPTGESNELRLHGRGVFVCISPWNFPLAIFAGQVVAALVAGNPVAAKPAEQTPGVAQAFVDLLHEAGLPHDAIALLHGPGETVGAALVAHPATAGVCFTGSTQVAKIIQRTLAASDGAIVPLIAETGGLNAMVVDSSALPEQVIDAVVQSAFRSAGQRCSALRLLLVHERVADGVIEMLRGAMQALVVGEAADLATDVGPVIDGEAHAGLTRHVQRLSREATLIGRAPMHDRFLSTHIAPVAFELKAIEDLREEVFGPVLHVVRWGGDVDALVARINALRYGLTLGIQTRIDSRALRIADTARVGNVYVNRNMIGAVVGVQPFGGEGLSGTGPKAGGPHYLYRFCAEQTLTINTAAAGGNAALLAGGH
ncbi:bifunctional proline dehydrogenase/L-glutamate gamma-semialdehyde dehydrogenase PutA [Ideonella sp. A 288]|uniref:bifunctional proline dehydrogenase/L-glutamate gamma-semialdehyde dehydrogenase PutA n=1 Tax=Ideonella sp. A 288 TaxID=1962181 RepID=UPI000B4C0542|nr:bifunctional proline dehydrogenase/L-glutamate gamma-semialdehyde dehydrogenase PutA [Ideonella sp. A 288]